MRPKYKLKKFQSLMQKRLTKKEIKMIKEQANLEFKNLKKGIIDKKYSF